jgi:hypothetical protein
MTAALVFHDLAFVNGCVVDHRNAGNRVKLIAEVAEESDHVITGSRPLPKCAALLCRLAEIPWPISVVLEFCHISAPVI